MRDRQHESFLSLVVGQRNHPTSALHKVERLEVPAAFQFQEVPEAVALVGQLLDPLLILQPGALEISFFRSQFDRQVHIT